MIVPILQSEFVGTCAQRTFSPVVENLQIPSHSRKGAISGLLIVATSTFRASVGSSSAILRGQSELPQWAGGHISNLVGQMRGILCGLRLHDMQLLSEHGCGHRVNIRATRQARCSEDLSPSKLYLLELVVCEFSFVEVLLAQPVMKALDRLARGVCPKW